MSPAASPFTDNTALLISMNRDISALIERTENLQDDVRELKDKFSEHSAATEAEFRRIRSGTSRTREKLSFLKGEWKVVALAAGLIVEHFWKARGH